MSENTNEREAFEAWAIAQKDTFGLPYFIIKKENGTYVDNFTNHAWAGYLAGQAHKKNESVADAKTYGLDKVSLLIRDVCESDPPPESGENAVSVNIYWLEELIRALIKESP